MSTIALRLYTWIVTTAVESSMKLPRLVATNEISKRPLRVYQDGIRFFTGLEAYQNLEPLWDSQRRVQKEGFSFGVLVKLAAKLLGLSNGASVHKILERGDNSCLIEEHGRELFPKLFPGQCIEELMLTTFCFKGRKTPLVMERSQRIQRSRIRENEDRGRDLPPSARSLFLDRQTVEIEGVTLLYDSDTDTWKFDREVIPLEVLVRFAVRILRDERTKEEWFPYYIPWLADDEELAVKQSGPSSLKVLAVTNDGQVALTQTERGYRLVSISEEAEGPNGEPLYFGDPEGQAHFSSWGDLVDAIATLLAEPSCAEHINAVGGDVPLLAKGDALLSWLYSPGAIRKVDLKEATRKALADRYGIPPGGGHDHYRRFHDGTEECVTLYYRFSTRLARADGELVLIDENGANPSFTMEELLTILALLLSDLHTRTERPLQFAPWLVRWLFNRYGPMARVRDEAPSRVERHNAEVVPVAHSRVPITFLWRLPEELSPSPYSVDLPADSPRDSAVNQRLEAENPELAKFVTQVIAQLGTTSK